MSVILSDMRGNGAIGFPQARTENTAPHRFQEERVRPGEYGRAHAHKGRITPVYRQKTDECRKWQKLDTV